MQSDDFYYRPTPIKFN